jgi:hypothetical protein
MTIDSEDKRPISKPIRFGPLTIDVALGSIIGVAMAKRFEDLFRIGSLHANYAKNG